MNKNMERLYNGIIKENPTFVLMLGMCPTLAVTSSAINGLGMGLSTTVVLILSNLLISAFRKIIPDGVRVPAFIVIVASLVTIVEFMMKAYFPSLSASLGVYIRAGTLYSADRCKLYYFRPCGELCFQKSDHAVHFRRDRHGPWLYAWTDLHRPCA